MAKIAWWFGAIAALGACGGATPPAAPASGRLDELRAAPLALGARVDAVAGLTEVRTADGVTIYRGGPAPAELAGLAIVETEVTARAGVVERIRHALDVPEVATSACVFASAYTELARGRWQAPFPEPYAPDALCALREELAPGRLVDACTGEGFRRDGQHAVVLHLRGRDDTGPRARVVVEYAVDASQTRADDAAHVATRIDEGDAVITEWTRRIGVATKVFDNTAMLATDPGKLAARTALREVRETGARVDCGYGLALVVYNHFLEGTNRAIDAGEASGAARAGELRQRLDAATSRRDQGKAAADALFARVQALLP